MFNIYFMESFIKKLYEYYEYVMKYEENIELDNLDLEDLEMDTFELKWAKQIVGRLMFQEKVFENKVTIHDSEMSENDGNYGNDGTEKDKKNKKAFSYGEFLTKNPGASIQERITAREKFYKRIRM